MVEIRVTERENFYEQILENNKVWVEAQLALDKDYFKDLAKGQTPPLRWIGCSDSRVPATVLPAGFCPARGCGFKHNRATDPAGRCPVRGAAIRTAVVLDGDPRGRVRGLLRSACPSAG